MSATSIGRVLRSAAIVVVMAAAVGVNLGGYTTLGYKWATRDVTYYVNPQSMHLSEAAAVSAIQRAADVWSAQSQANIRLVYAGSTNGSSVGMNGKSEVFFRNSSNGSYVAETYVWVDGSGSVVDADIVFHEGAYRFFTNSGCNAGIYVENAGAHEFGHALGIQHSATTAATMYRSMSSYCDLTWMTLESDDIAAVESLYPATSTRQLPSAPSGLAVTLNSGSPTSSLVLSWGDNASTETGYRIERSGDGVSFNYLAQVGANVRSFTNNGLAAGTTYYYRVYAVNGDGDSAFSNVASGRTQAPIPTTATTPTTPTSGALLSARGYKVKGQSRADLTWSGVTAAMVDVIRDGARAASTANDGSETDALTKKGVTGATYRVCAAGTSVCSNTVSVTF